VALGAAAEFATFARSDMAFLLYAAGRVLDGARLYVDVVEINPPLIVAINLPPVLLARALGVSDIAVYRVLVVLALLGSLAFSWWALNWVFGPGREPLRRRLLLVLAFALFLAPGNDFGQREHLLVALTLPYLLLAAARAGGRPAPPWPAAAAGVLAGVGLALKPHYLLVWAAVEAYAAWRRRARRLSPEAAGTVVFLAIYVAAVALVTPEYFRLVATLGPAYGGYLRDPFLHVLVTAPGTTVCYLAVFTWAALARRSRHPGLWAVVAIALVASFVAGAAQQKGWTYHFYPPVVLALFLLGLAVLDVERPLRRTVQQAYAAVAFAALATGVFWAVTLAAIRVAHRDPVREREQAQLDQLVAAVRRHAPPHGSLYVLSYTIGSSFPLVNYSGVSWASRFPHLWIVEAAYQDQLQGTEPVRYRPRERMPVAERYLNDAVYQDLARYHPDVLLVLWQARDVQQNGLRRLDYLGYFGRDPRIAAQLGGYRLAEEVGQYHLYVRGAGVGKSSSGGPPVSEPGRYDILRTDLTGRQAVVADRPFLISAMLFLLLAILAFRREHAALYRGREEGEPAPARSPPAVS
jgi:hypothetical protein